MTKKDLHSLTVAGGFGLVGAFALWFFFRRAIKVPVLLPAQVKWEGQ